MLTVSNIPVKGSRGFKINESKGFTANDTSPLQNIIKSASSNSSTAKPKYEFNRIENFRFLEIVYQLGPFPPKTVEDHTP